MIDQKKLPEVSIIIPCYNESTTITLLLDALFDQTYPRDPMNVIIADGGSTDGTQDVISSWQDQHPGLKIEVILNPKRTIPAALNCAIRAATGDIIIRLDAHSKPNLDYVKRIVNLLESGQADNVGGVWDIQPSGKGWMARSIAAAAGHPIGVGDAQYRFTDKPAYVDTVPFGAFYRTLVDEIGMFDETLLTNEDYEFNTRIRQHGGKIWLDPQIRAVYYARGDLKALANQYWRYGYWKWHMLRRYPKTLRWRQALPPLFILTLVFSALLTTFFKPFLWLFLALLGIYVLALLMAGLQLALKHHEHRFIVGVPLAMACMHFSWGSGFLWGIIHPQKGN